MAVAEKTIPETVPHNPRQQLALHALLGALFVFLSLALVFSGLPSLWREFLPATVLNEFLADALLMVVLIPTMVGLFFLGKHLLGPTPERGVRAGAFLGAVALFLTLLIALAVDNALAPQNMGPTIEVGISLLVAAGLLYGIYWALTRPQVGVWLGRLEDNGWFDMGGFKPNQGVRVRRGTVIGLLTLVICGVYVLVQHRNFAGNNWEIALPFLGERVLPILYRLNITVPLLIVVAASWLSWRVINWPTFADFLIATEAEMNKVSWTTRKRLFQDTIVVLVTVFLFTVFLFAVDILWVYVLSNPVVRVLYTDPMAERAKQNQQSSW